MKKQELMMGNSVWRPCCNDEVTEIRDNGIIGLDSFRGLISFEELHPIPITEEWLLKNGFEKVEILGSVFYQKWLSDAKLEMYYGETNMRGRNWYLHIDNADCNTIARVAIQYVHQFQDMLNIMDIEMEVEI